jgi:glucokinase
MNGLFGQINDGKAAEQFFLGDVGGTNAGFAVLVGGR